LEAVMKKTCTLLLVMALLLAQFNSLPVHADELSGDFYYIENPDSTITITGYTDSAPRDHVVIPQMINGKTVTAIGDGAFQSKSIQSLELPDGLVSIGKKAFLKNLLTSLEITGNVKVIEEGAFQNNELASLTIHDGVEMIGTAAFIGNQITSLILPDSVTEINNNAFFGNRIAGLVLPNNLVEITDNAFYGNRLTTIDIPASVRIIGDSAFSGNRIVELVIPSTVTHLKRNAFHYNALESVTFLGTPSLADVSVFSNQFSDITNSDMHNWYTDTAYTQAWNNTVTSPMTIYAAWKSNIITFNPNGGSNVGNQSIGFSQKGTAVIPTKTEHTFAGWFKEKELINQWDFNTDTVIRNITLYAKWDINTYTVSFQSNGGTAVADQTIAYDGAVVPPTNPSKAEHTFAGWYTNSGLTTPWNFGTNKVKGNMTLYAKWTAHTYTVNFQSNGGTAVAAQTKAYDGKVASPANPSKLGYTFAGWYTNPGLTTAWNFDADLVKGDMTLYAKWTANTYTIIFQTNGGSAVAAQTIAYDNKVARPTTPSKAEHTFEGWYANSGLTTPWNFDTDLVKGAMRLYAKWTVNTYTVSFNSNGGSTVAARTIAYDDKVVPPTNPSKAGHTFAGWYANSGLTAAWNFDTSVVKGDMTLYAKWTANTYTVSFQSNGGSAVAAQTIAYNDKVVLPANPSKAGHTFAGWHTNSGLTTVWNFGTGLVKGDMTLYAKWTVNTYTVSFQSNGGSAVTAQTIAFNSKVVSPTNPSKAGHTFAGWYKDKELTTHWMFATDVITEDITLYAGWDKETYTVSFDTSGGSDIIDQQIQFEDKAVLPASPKKSGFTFAGWFKDEDLKLSWDFKTDIVTADLTLYAKWSKIIYVEAPGPVIEPEPEPEPKPEEDPVQNVCPTRFTDISGHWAENAIRDITGRCIIIGYPDGEFKPNAPLIRAHVAVMLTRALELPPNRPLNSFHDVSNNSPYYEAILTASQAGIFEGTNGYFYPTQQLTRAQMAKILVISFNLPLGGKSTFHDVPNTHWASPYIAALESHGLAFGKDGHYKPEEPVTRAQFVAFMYRALH